MATLRSPDGALWPVAARTLIGRAPACTLCLSEPLASSEHATLVWSGGAWMLRDLGSRNGTFIDGRRMQGAEVVGPGQKLGFGGKGEWELIDAGAPGAMAMDLATRALIPAQDGLLALPNDGAPELSIFVGPTGFMLERADGEVRAAQDMELVQASGKSFRIMLPVVLEGTPMIEQAMTIDRIAFRFSVSRNEEYVELAIEHDGASIALERRDHHYVLLTLARLRLEDAGHSPAERGWIDRERLLKMLGMEPNAFNVAVHRARHQLAAAGVEQAAGVVEVRPGQRRFGSDRFTVSPL